MNRHIRQHAIAFMASRHVVTLATVGGDGLRISPAFYVLCDDFDFWFITFADNDFEAATFAAGIARSDPGEPEDIAVRVDGSSARSHGRTATPQTSLVSEKIRSLPSIRISRSSPSVLPRSARPSGARGVVT